MIPGRPRRYDNTEPWESTVPAALIPAVKHLRKSFEDIHWGFGQTARKYCYAALHSEEIDDPANEYFNYLMHMKGRVGTAATRRFHDLVKQGTPSAIFKGFFDLYIDGVTIQAVVIFKELVEVGHANIKRLAANHLEWAEAQTKHLIRSEVHQIPTWVRDVCDVQVHDPQDDDDEWIYWKKWQAPMFVVMKPSRYQPYHAMTAWERKDSNTSSQWLESFTQYYVLHLESRVREAAGAAALELAKKSELVGLENEGSPLPSSVDPAAAGRSTANSPRREVRRLDSQARYKLWQMKYRELKKDRPDMSDVWYSQQIARLGIAERQTSETIRKHMTK